jgi:hypothetical protein
MECPNITPLQDMSCGDSIKPSIDSIQFSNIGNCAFDDFDNYLGIWEYNETTNVVTITKDPYLLLVSFDTEEGDAVFHDARNDKNSIPPPFHKEPIVITVQIEGDDKIKEFEEFIKL